MMMTPIEKDIKDIFSNSTRTQYPSDIEYYQLRFLQERAYKEGVKNLKRVALGSFRMSGEFSLEEMTELLVRTNIAQSASQAVDILPLICNTTLEYGHLSDLRIRRLKDSKQNTRYGMNAYNILKINPKDAPLLAFFMG